MRKKMPTGEDVKQGKRTCESCEHMRVRIKPPFKINYENPFLSKILYNNAVAFCREGLFKTAKGEDKTWKIGETGKGRKPHIYPSWKIAVDCALYSSMDD